MSPDPDLPQAVRRLVGIAALRRLRRLVDAEMAHDRQQALWARRIAAIFGLALAAFLVWLISRAL